MSEIYCAKVQRKAVFFKENKLRFAEDLTAVDKEKGVSCGQVLQLHEKKAGGHILSGL